MRFYVDIFFAVEMLIFFLPVKFWQADDSVPGHWVGVKNGNKIET